MVKFDKSYVSPLDLFLEDFEKKHPARSESQEKAIKKFKRIISKRDNVQMADSIALFEELD